MFQNRPRVPVQPDLPLRKRPGIEKRVGWLRDVESRMINTSAIAGFLREGQIAWMQHR
jgi:hypothetical protein